MITVHHLNNSRSQRVLWLLEELGLDYTIKHYQRDARTLLAPAALRQVHPLGKSPVITDDGQTIAESGAIIEYLVERYGKGRLLPPAGTKARLRYTYWMHYAEGTLMPLMVMSLIFNTVERRAPLLVRPIARAIAGQVKRGYLSPNIKANLDFLESELGRSLWFCGDELSAADVQMSFALEAAAARGGLDESRPKLKTFLERVQTRPAYRKALEKGGPYQLLN